MVDIIIFAIIAFVIAYRLYNVLGATDEFDPMQAKGQVINLDPNEYQEQKEDDSAEIKEADDNIEQHLTKTALASINKIKKIDASFSSSKFLQGAEKAFEIIINAFANGDKKTLTKLANQDVAEKFIGEYDRQKKLGNKINISIVGLESSKINKVDLSGNVATISVKFLSEQIATVTDKAGQVVSGDEKNVEEISDHWFFTKDLKGDSPIWVLAKTES